MYKTSFSAKAIILILFVGIYNIILSSSASAFTYNPDFIVSDTDATNYLDMTRKEIQQFLSGKNSKLAYYEALTKQGVYKTAATIISSMAHKYKMSKRFLLVLLQREQSLVTDEDPSEDQLDWATGYGICDRCSKKDPALQRWKGFSQQVTSAAAQFRDYFDHPENYSIKAGVPTNIDKSSVTPQNQATANLYVYTPHLEGNENFARIWTEWFGPSERPGMPKVRLPYPDGSLLKLFDDATVWYIQNGQRRAIASYSVLVSRFKPEKIITARKKDIEKYTLGAPVNFPQYSLVEDESHAIYLIINDKKRKFESQEVFRKIGYNPEEVISAKSSELSGYATDFPITKYTLYPTGSLAQNTVTGGVYYIESGKKYPIVDRLILTLYFSGSEIQKMTPEGLEGIMTAEPYKLRDGELVLSMADKKVYIISNGERRPIASEEAFNKLGYKWEQIITAPEKLLNIHTLGEEIKKP